MHWAKTGDFWTSGQSDHPPEVLQASLGASLSRPPEFMRGRAGGSRGDGKTSRHLAGKKDRYLLESWPGQNAQEEKLYKKWLFWAPSPELRGRKQAQTSVQ